jgi:hypothetical protein
MTPLATITGYLVIAAICSSVIAAAFSWTVYMYHRLFEHAKNAAVLHMAGRFNQDAYWFGEDPTTAWLLHKIAADLTTHGWSDVSSVRDEWLRRRKSASVNQNQITEERITQ